MKHVTYEYADAYADYLHYKPVNEYVEDADRSNYSSGSSYYISDLNIEDVTDPRMLALEKYLKEEDIHWHRITESDNGRYISVYANPECSWKSSSYICKDAEDYVKEFKDHYKEEDK